MEVCLNLLWLVLSLTGVSAFALPLSRKLHATRHVVTGLLTLGCALIIIFPVISISDDLQSLPFAIEDGSSTCKVKITKLAEGRAGDYHHHAPAANRNSCPPEPDWEAADFIPNNETHAAAQLFSSSISQRAPPVFIL